MYHVYLINITVRPLIGDPQLQYHDPNVFYLKIELLSKWIPAIFAIFFKSVQEEEKQEQEQEQEEDKITQKIAQKY